MQVSEWVCKVLTQDSPNLTHLNEIKRCKTSNSQQPLQERPKRLNSREASANS